MNTQEYRPLAKADLKNIVPWRKEYRSLRNYERWNIVPWRKEYRSLAKVPFLLALILYGFLAPRFQRKRTIKVQL